MLARVCAHGNKFAMLYTRSADVNDHRRAIAGAAAVADDECISFKRKWKLIAHARNVV